MLVEGNQREGERVRDRERETYLQSMLRCESRPADGWDAARSLARRDVDPAQGEWFQRVARGGAQGGCGSQVGETTLRTAGREGEGFAQGGEDGGPRGRGLMFGHTNAPPQSFKASSSLPRPYKDDEGMVGSARET